MELFTSKSTVNSLQNESTSVLSAFKQTITKLQDISKRATSEKEIKLKEISKLEQEAKQLEALSKDNLSIAINLDKLLKPE